MPKYEILFVGSLIYDCKDRDEAWIDGLKHVKQSDCRITGVRTVISKEDTK